MKLNSLYIKSFRGATKPVTIEFDNSKKITMLFAENGNGKSTIADALICLCTDKMGSLDDKSSIDKSFLKSLGAGTGETKITLNTDAGAFTTSISGTAKAFVKTPATDQPSLKFLRRSQIINLINSQASDRYTALKDYLDVSNIYTGEEALRKVFREVEKDLGNSISVLQSANETLEKFWKAEGSPDGAMLVWAKIQTEKDLSKEAAIYKVLAELVTQWQAIGNKQREINQFQTATSASQKNMEGFALILKNLEAANKKNKPALLALLQEAKNYISAEPVIDKCPVCENGIVKATVVNSLDVQIKSMAALQKASKDLETATKTHDKNVAILNTAIRGMNTLLIKYKTSISQYVDKVPDIAPFVNGIKTEANANYKIYVASYKELQALFVRIEKSAVDKKTSIDQHALIKLQYNSITQHSEKFEKLAALKTATTKALGIVETTRKVFYDNELLSISAEVEQMYQKIHPAEGLGGIKLFLNPNFKTSLEIQANFHSQQAITPQSVYSESHLDTLGICIFLALAKKYSDSTTVLILDDVVMSVDENHLDRFIALLHDEADNFAHIIVTTHYRPWKDRYKNNRAPASSVHFLELRTWSTQNGIRVFNGRIALDELRQMLTDESSFHRENIAAASGRILENLLDFVTLKFGCKVARKPKNDYQLSELLDGLSKDLLKNFKVEHLEKDVTGKYTSVIKQVDLKPVIDKLKALKAVRNQVGAHFNFDGSLVSDGDVEDFGNATVEFAELLICPECGALPDRNKSGSYWETKTGSIKLFPLIEP
jgi:energy-coupling factor transporter ATP-binding protein EcfA2